MFTPGSCPICTIRFAELSPQYLYSCTQRTEINFILTLNLTASIADISDRLSDTADSALIMSNTTRNKQYLILQACGIVEFLSSLSMMNNFDHEKT